MELFKQGYNCAQSVILSFADILESSGLADEHPLRPFLRRKILR